MAEKQPVRVTIFGQTYTIMAPGDPREVERAAARVDDLMHTISAKSPAAETSRVAVLACLHLADRLETLEHDLSQLRSRVDSKTEEFSLLLEQAIESAP